MLQGWLFTKVLSRIKLLASFAMNRVDYFTYECNLILGHGRLARLVWVHDLSGFSPSPGGKPISVGDLLYSTSYGRGGPFHVNLLVC